jgi:hypothetical protein
MMRKKVLCTILGLTLTLGMGITSMAAPVAVEGGGVFDAEYYAENNPDVVAAFGTDFSALWQHFTIFGIGEGRLPFSIGTDWEYVLQNGPFQTLTTTQAVTTDTTATTTTTTPVEEKTETTQTTTTTTVASLNDTIGSYNGVAFSATGTSFNDTFGKDGWVLDPDRAGMQGSDGYYYYINNKYPDVRLTVTLENGMFTDYGIDAQDAFKAGSTKYPNMTWNGLTLGSSESDLLAAYQNEWVSLYGRDDFNYGAEYDITLSDGSDSLLVIYVTSTYGIVSVDFWK